MKRIILLCLVIVVIIASFVLVYVFWKPVAPMNSSQQNKDATKNNSEVMLASQSACKQNTCQQFSYVCGNMPDGCGGTKNCGSCTSGQQCDDDGHCSKGNSTSDGMSGGGGGGDSNCVPDCSEK